MVFLYRYNTSLNLWSSGCTCCGIKGGKCKRFQSPCWMLLFHLICQGNKWDYEYKKVIRTFSVSLCFCNLEANNKPWDEEGFLWGEKKACMVLLWQLPLVHKAAFGGVIWISIDAQKSWLCCELFSMWENIFHVLCPPLVLVCIEITSTAINVMNWTQKTLPAALWV